MTMTIEEIQTKRKMRAYQVTRAETAVQKALYDLWYKHYTKDIGTEKRKQLVYDFITDHLDTKLIKLTKPFIRHPETRLKSYSRTCTPLEILADFMIRAKQTTEKIEEYPVQSADTSFRHAKKRKEKELSIQFQSETDRDNSRATYTATKGFGYTAPKMPPYSITESELLGGESPVESVIFGDTKKTVANFRKQIRHAQRNVEFYATSYEELGYDFDEAKKRIRRLDIKRVRACEICGQPFYAHDLRRWICDLQVGVLEKGELSKSSACELISARKRAEKARKMAS